jgi:hypothetical protein
VFLLCSTFAGDCCGAAKLRVAAKTRLNRQKARK